MTTTAIRKKLHEYIADTTDNKVKGMYLLLKDEMDQRADFEPTSMHLEILEEEKRKHVAGISKSYSIEEARQFIRGNKKSV